VSEYTILGWLLQYTQDSTHTQRRGTEREREESNTIQKRKRQQSRIKIKREWQGLLKNMSRR